MVFKELFGMSGSGDSATGTEEECQLSMIIPLENEKEAEVVYRAIVVDKEPSRSHVRKQIQLDKTRICIHLAAKDFRSLRIATNGVTESVKLVLDTIKEFAPGNL